MKKTLTICALLLACSLGASAQSWGYRSGFDFKYGTQNFTNVGTGEAYDSELAVGLSWNWKQMQLHRKPIANMVYLGIDTGLSLDLAKYSTVEIGDDYQRGESLAEGLVTSTLLGNWEMMEGELGFHIGPYVKIAPLGFMGNTDLRICAYYHYIPSLSVYALNRYGVAYNPFTAIGATIGWKFINVGYEVRSGAADYTSVTSKELEGYIKDRTGFSDVKTEGYKTAAQRVFVRLSF